LEHATRREPGNAVGWYHLGWAQLEAVVVAQSRGESRLAAAQAVLVAFGNAVKLNPAYEPQVRTRVEQARQVVAYGR
jgi:hypothetical protein